MASLVDYLKQQGMGSSFGDRGAMFSQYGMEGDYTGSSQQNTALLQRAMQNSNVNAGMGGDFNMLNALSSNNSNVGLGETDYGTGTTIPPNQIGGPSGQEVYGGPWQNEDPVIQNGNIFTPYQQNKHMEELRGAGVDAYNIPQQMEFRRPEGDFSAGNYMPEQIGMPTMKPMGLFGRAKHAFGRFGESIGNQMSKIGHNEAAQMSKTFGGTGNYLPTFGGKQ